MDKEKTFEWNDELVQKFAEEYRFSSSRISLDQFIKRCETDKPQEEQRPTVTRCNYDDDNVYFYIDNKIPSIDIDKKRLAEIIINESSKNWERKSKPMSEEDVIAPKQKAIINGCPSVSPFEDAVNKKVYSQKEYLQFGEQVFNAARKNNTELYYKFKNFSDYMNSKGEEK